MAVDSGPEKGSPSQKDTENTSLRKQIQNSSAEDAPFKKDKAYKKFASNIKETLNSFDSRFQDWADYISFLNRLLKAVHGHPSHISILPYKAVVAQRLAQSLSPSLPNGVHQRALDVYAYVFNLIEKEALARDLSLYFPGLSTTLSFGSLSVRSEFLAIFETHILPLPKAAIRPALKAIILSLLPGLEDETSEDFERTLILIDGFQSRFRESSDSSNFESVDDGFFWQCFFLAAIASSSRSQGALAFLNRRLPKMGSTRSSYIEELPAEKSSVDTKASVLPKSIEAVVSPEPGLLIRCLASGLQHEQVLIQRGFLDLLSSHIPLHSQVLQSKVQTEDLDKLVLAATGIVLRRDTSLNRRLWNWFLGPEAISKEGVDSDPTSPGLFESNENKAPPGSQGSHRNLYFQTYGLSPLIRALRHEIGTEQLSPVKKARPLRICQSLMDRWEIGGLVIPEIFLPAIDSVRTYREVSLSHENFTEVLRSANVFFDGVEASLIWRDLVGLMASALSPTSRKRQERSNDLAIVDFTINYFNIRDDEMLETHIPLSILGLQAMVINLNERTAVMENTREEEWLPICVKALSIIDKLVELLPENQARKDSTEKEVSPIISDAQTANILVPLHDFYVEKQGSLGVTQPPFTSGTTFNLLLRQSFSMLTSALNSRSYDDQFFIKGRIAITLAGKLSSNGAFPCNEIFEALVAALTADTTAFPLSHKAFYLMVNLAICLISTSKISSSQTSQLVGLLVKHAWEFLSPSSPKFHVETVRSLWQIQQVLPIHDRQIEGILSELISKDTAKFSKVSHAAEPARRFAILWSHTIQQTYSSNDASSARPQTPRRKDISHQRLSPSTNFEIMLSRPLFLVLDSLEDESTELFVFVRGWIQTMPGMERLFWAIGSKILACSFFQRLGVEFLTDENVPIPHDILESDDLKTALYYFHTLSSVLRWSSSTTWSCLSQDMTLSSNQLQVSEDEGPRKFDYQTFFSKVALYIIMCREVAFNADISPLRRTALSVLQYIMASPFAESLSLMELEYPLIETLSSSLEMRHSYLQVSLLDCVIASLKLRMLRETYSSLPDSEIGPQSHRRTSSKETSRSLQLSIPSERSDVPQTGPQPPPPQLLTCLQEAFASPGTRPVLDSWISFLTEVMPLYSEVIFQVLIPLVECLCAQISLTFEGLKIMFSAGSPPNSIAPESTLIAFINGLEQVLARAHDQLITEEINDTSTPGPTQTPGFFGNMVSGVFSSESTRGRSATANDRLTVILSFQDTVRICYRIWAWGTNRSGSGAQDSASLASFAYTSLRMRNRARRMLEHLFAAESLECLEVLVDIWRTDKQRGEKRASLVFDLLHVLDGSRPKHTIPAIFNAIYSRANPNALDPMRQSTLTSDLADTDVVTFLVDYARTLEDDAMDEIWTDCMTFIKDVLLNPFPHRQTLPRLLEFTSILGEKVDNTNFGEQRRMRRELGDLFMRVLTATFTSRPMGFAQESVQPTKLSKERYNDGASPGKYSSSIRSDDIVSILAVIVPSLPTVLVDGDRILAAATAISTNIISPTIRSRAFPENFGVSVSKLLYLLSRLPNSQKAWKKDVADAFNDPRFFNVPPSMLKAHWLRLIRQWTLGDKERMPELLSRLTAPTTAGIMFGVGANSARLEADRKAQSNLRRIAILILATTDDNFVVNLDAIQSKLADLLAASVASSPSSVTRTEVFLVFRALVLKTSSIHLAPLWPIISIELQNALSAAFLSQTEAYNVESILQACKLLDVLLVVAPDDFQLHEWLFITDTIDAVYRPASFEPTALVDEISDKLGSTSASSTEYRSDSVTESGKTQSMRRPLLSPGVGKGVKQEEILPQILIPFFSHLSIHAFESTYSMDAVDWESCRESLLIDLCDDESFSRP